MIKIADYFNVSVDFLVGRTDKERMAEGVSGSRMSNRERKVIDSFRKLSETEQNSIELVMHNYLNKK